MRSRGRRVHLPSLYAAASAAAPEAAAATSQIPSSQASVTAAAAAAAASTARQIPSTQTAIAATATTVAAAATAAEATSSDIYLCVPSESHASAWRALCTIQMLGMQRPPLPALRESRDQLHCVLHCWGASQNRQTCRWRKLTLARHAYLRMSSMYTMREVKQKKVFCRCGERDMRCAVRVP